MTCTDNEREPEVYPEVTRCLAARYDSGPCLDRGQIFVAVKKPDTSAGFMGGQGSRARSIAYNEEKSPCVKTTLSGGNAIPEVVYPIGSFMDTGATARSISYDETVAPPLKSIGGNAIPNVVYQNTGRGWWNESEVCETIRTPCGGDAMKANLVVEVVDSHHYEQISLMEEKWHETDISGALRNNPSYISHIILNEKEKDSRV